MSIWIHGDRFSTTPHAHRLTLGEGETPLVPSRSIGPQAGLRELYFKLEMVNPTGSYKDRFAAAAVSDMLATGATRCVATSSGNTGSALAAYCAAAGIRCQIAIVETAPAAKLEQMLAYGAELCRVRGFGTDAGLTTQVVDTIGRLGSRAGSARQISAYCCSPTGMRGVESIGYELADQLPHGISHIFCPAGGGGLTLAAARSSAAASPAPPRVHCVQPTGNDTIATALRSGADEAQPVTCTTAISGLQVASVLDGNEVIAACRASGGNGFAIPDNLIYDAQARLAREEGIFCEPAAAVALAGALQARERGELAPDDVAVCLVTGSGFKDRDSVERMTSTAAAAEIDADQLEDAFAA